MQRENTVTCLSGLFLLYVLPLVLAGERYMDDHARALMGEAGRTWLYGNARPLTELSAILVNFGDPVLDLAPLTLFLGLFALALSLRRFARAFFPGRGGPWMACALSFYLVSPFFLENLSFRYDALAMILALCGPLLVFEGMLYPRMLPRASRGLLACLTGISFYQGIYGAYFSFVLMEAILRLGRGENARDVGKIALAELSGILAAGVLFKAAVGILGAGHGYLMGQAAMIPLSAEGLHAFSAHFWAWLGVLGEYAASVPILLAVPVLLGAFIALLLLAREQENTLIRALILLSPMLMVIFAILPLSLLSDSIFRCRLLISIGAPTLWLGLLIFSLAERKKAAKWLLALSLLFAFSFSYAYGNALHSQSRYDDYLAQSIARDMEGLSPEEKGEIRCISVAGEESRAPELSPAIERHPLFARLVPVAFRRDQFASMSLLLRYYPLGEAPLRPLTGEDERVIREGKPIVERRTYALYRNGEKCIVVFPPAERERERRGF